MVKIDLQDNGGWYAAKYDAEWVTSDCEDCGDGVQQLVLRYRDDFNDFPCQVCPKHLEGDEAVRIRD